MEATFNKAILVAEDASNQIKRIARDESDRLIEDAKKNASRIVNNALLEAEKTQRETEQLRRNIITFKKKIKKTIFRKIN
ncbi:MAG: DivIVA domain-containing protein [Clostridium sp.]|nr:MAG: DivIVA domain-containing protein [Clostridium sp.]